MGGNRSRLLMTDNEREREREYRVAQADKEQNPMGWMGLTFLKGGKARTSMT